VQEVIWTDSLCLHEGGLVFRPFIRKTSETRERLTPAAHFHQFVVKSFSIEHARFPTSVKYCNTALSLSKQHGAGKSHVFYCDGS
jgi:hypothetical protein